MFAQVSLILSLIRAPKNTVSTCWSISRALVASLRYITIESDDKPIDEENPVSTNMVWPWNNCSG